MEDKNELNDIILNKNNSSNGNKKVILAVATLGVVLIIVVMLMNTLTSNGTDNLPQAVLPPEPKPVTSTTQPKGEPLFEEVEVIQEDAKRNDELDKIAQKLKKESEANKPAPVKEEPAVEYVEPEKPVVQEPVHKAVVKPTPKPKVKTASKGHYYVQVGSFSRYSPDKKFLSSITNRGYKYSYHKVTRNNKTLNKVLIGPFNSERDARAALTNIRKHIIKGAFLTKI